MDDTIQAISNLVQYCLLMSLVREDHDVLLSPVIVSVFVNFIYRESHEKFLQNEKLEGLKKQKAKKKTWHLVRAIFPAL